MKNAVVGLNDLSTLHSEIAREAFEWDPSQFLAGSNSKMKWKCSTGHIFEATIKNRVNGRGCPVCANRTVLKGFNDLGSKFPTIAKQAYGWDPEKFVHGSNKLMSWICENNHIFQCKISERTIRGIGCPYCANVKVLAGFNDLKTTHPDIAAKANDWNPEEFIAGSPKKKSWKCEIGHIFTSEIRLMIRSKGSLCPICSRKEIVSGVNDLATSHPELAKDAVGWNPADHAPNSHKKVRWQCQEFPQHKFDQEISKRVLGQGCPFCAGRKLLEGFNDLKTKFPELAAEADGWDPSQVLSGTQERKSWLCDEGHRWIAQVRSRTGGYKSGCPECAESGYSTVKDGWFYLMYRSGEQQLGITNVPKHRLSTHYRNGWSLMEIVGPFNGFDIAETEKLMKTWLKNTIGTVIGTSENWYTKDLEVQSLKELFVAANIKPLFPFSGLDDSGKS